MHHLTDLIWLVLTFGIVGLATWVGSRTRLGTQLAGATQEHPRTFLAVSGVIYTVIVLQWSARNGRLATDPQWDDVTYLLDAQQRLTIFDWQGFLKVIESFWKFPPHSPWSTACALFAFMIFGLHAWTPYVVNVVLILGLLMLLHALLPDITVGERLFLSGVPLLLPISARLVQEFRPDPALAVAMATFCLSTLKLSFFSPTVANRWQTHFWLGLVAGLALLIKPSFLYHTLVIMTLTEVGSALGVSLHTRSFPFSRNRLGCGAAFFGAAVLASGGYYVRALPQTLSYIHTNTANTEEVEVHRLHTHALGDILKDFLGSGEMARMLGPFLIIFSIVVALGLVYFVRRHRWSDAGYIASVLTCAIVSIAILAYARLDNPYFGIFWELALTIAALHVVAQVRKSGPIGRRLTSGFAVLVVGTFLTHSPFAQFYPPSPDARTGHSLNRAIVLKIAQAWALTSNGEKRPAQVQVCFGGSVNGPAQAWLARELHYPLEFGGTIEVRSAEATLGSMALPDFVEVADPGSAWLYRWLPSSLLQGELLERLRADAAFSELPAALGQEGKVYIFRRN